jgi:hypothetical protein
MGMMYAWASKEYLLWECSIGQIILYHNKGMEIKYPSNDKPVTSNSLLNMSEEELRKMRDDYRKQYGDIGNG